MFSLWKVRDIADKMTNVVMNYSDMQAKVREATNDEAWGPTGALMQELAHATFTYEHFSEVMSMLWKRMLEDDKQWRRTYKSLLVLSYLIKNGSEQVVVSARDHIYHLRNLENYTFIDSSGKDQGANIRQTVKKLINLLGHNDLLREERKKAKKNRGKYIGIGSEMKFQGESDVLNAQSGLKINFTDDNWDDSYCDYYNNKTDHADSDKKDCFPVAVSTDPDKKMNLRLNPKVIATPKKPQNLSLEPAANFVPDHANVFDDFDPRLCEQYDSATAGHYEIGSQTPFEPMNAENNDDFADFISARLNASLVNVTPTITSNPLPPILTEKSLLNRSTSETPHLLNSKECGNVGQQLELQDQEYFLPKSLEKDFFDLRDMCVGNKMGSFSAELIENLDGDLLMPSPAMPLQPTTITNSTETASAISAATKSQPLGSTWASSETVIIDMDNLLSGKPKPIPSLSINQLMINSSSQKSKVKEPST
ncbi:uncharacterized protein LOC126738285 [Anthonomus grandis grandis]|uniref:uncharacterized protein LOC126738285 n=1 Tax=Anthonomus grandis grandis TaxID=2921223 RepID=UPI0021653FFD|nr:uncharacterized protein LOC126738285 [Anthonomus grandis grandis]